MGSTQVRFFTDPEPFHDKESCYLKVRQLEGRLLSDEIVKKLPSSSLLNIYAKEWIWRARSLARLKRYLPQHKPLKILDLGCGNGWLANQLAENQQWTVWALDLNKMELEQGARLFGSSRLTFAYADVLQSPFPEKNFDVIVLTASVQYFPDLSQLIVALRKLLNPKGKIHVLDTPFYQNESEQTAAQQRTLNYYTQLGVPQMANYYHHHLWPKAQQLGAKNLNNTIQIKLLQRVRWLAPFPWLQF
jgi:ubiquinone/menaquinone biosynthesis C-methylase UbiE